MTKSNSMPIEDEYVWYVAYGPEMSKAIILEYFKDYKGPEFDVDESMLVYLDRNISFSKSKSTGKIVPFLALEESKTRTYARAYKMSFDQFQHIRRKLDYYNINVTFDHCLGYIPIALTSERDLSKTKPSFEDVQDMIIGLQELDISDTEIKKYISKIMK